MLIIIDGLPLPGKVSLNCTVLARRLEWKEPQFSSSFDCIKETRNQRADPLYNTKNRSLRFIKKCYYIVVQSKEQEKAHIHTLINKSKYK